MKFALASAGIYNLVWGAFAVFAPLTIFSILGLAAPNYPELWQCIGMVIGVFGICYLIASQHPMDHWIIVLAGLLSKVLLPIGLAKAIYEGRFPAHFAWLALVNDLVWWAPFGLILLHKSRLREESIRAVSPEIQGWAMRATSQYDISILEHSKLRPVLLVFLRHVGCTFCRQALSDLSKVRRDIEAAGTQIVLIHMGQETTAETILKRYNMFDVPRIWDPHLALYRAFGLEKGVWSQLAGPKVIWRGLKAGILNLHGHGGVQGSHAQMPGVFLVFHGEILKSYRHQSAADRPDYMALAGELTAQR